MSEQGPCGPKAYWARQAQALVDRGAGRTDDEIHDLLCWLKDMNWPGAAIIAAHLATLGPEIREPLRHVLRSSDDVWIAWTLSCLGRCHDARFWAGLQDDLRALAGSSDQELSTDAMQLLERHGLSQR
jgi:hypothetical protein